MKTFMNKPITLVGRELKVGDKAPEFTVVDNELQPKSLKDYDTNYVVINVVPSLDTTVCDLQTKTVNEELAKRTDITTLTISNDLPFAQSRWCGAAGLDSVITLSDYQKHDFGNKYGTLIEELQLLARSIFVLDNDRKVVYVEYANEMAKHLDYDKFLEFVETLPGN